MIVKEGRGDEYKMEDMEMEMYLEAPKGIS